MNAKIFISHSSSDQKVAKSICAALEHRGLVCWIASRDVGPGQNYMDAIVRAIRSAKVMVLVFSQNANLSGEILKELSLASKYKVNVIPARIENVVPSEAFELEFATRQWIDLFDNWEAEIGRLASWIISIAPIEPDAGAIAKPVETPVQFDAPPASNPPAPSISESRPEPARSDVGIPPPPKEEQLLPSRDAAQSPTAPPEPIHLRERAAPAVEPPAREVPQPVASPSTPPQKVSPAALNPKYVGMALAAAVVVIFAAVWIISGQREQSRKEFAAYLTAQAEICAQKFRSSADGAANLAALKKLSSWQRSDFIEKGGWGDVTISGECAEILVL